MSPGRGDIKLELDDCSPESYAVLSEGSIPFTCTIPTTYVVGY